MSSLYLHFPFCASRCIYCGFYSTTGLNLQREYVDALLQELAMHSKDEWQPFGTVYFGGGTPSTLPTEQLARLTAAIKPLSTDDAEWTMECNPDDITPELASWLKESPINRISMGAQTFADERLKWLHRRHTSQQVSEAVRLLKANGIDNISIDLMFGFPNETLPQWQEDIAHVLDLRPQHISAYTLMYEEGTPLYRMLEQGKISEIDEELSLQMYDTLIDTLTAGGYEHYEISNFALPGRRSRHNSNYWNQTRYLGLGAAAHSYDGRHRWWNIADVRQYISGIMTGQCPRESEEIDAQTRYNDIVTTALRTREGISLDMLSPDERTYIIQQAQPHIAAHRLALTPTNLHLTRSGLYVSDDIMVDLIAT